MRITKGMKPVLLAFAVFCSLVAVSEIVPTADQSGADERRCFQTHQVWSPRTNLNAEVAIVYGIDPTLPSRVESWRQHGYRIHVMTGVAWGRYQDYLNGKFDGTDHWDQAQTDREGKPILHGGRKDMPYISPSEAYGRYLTVGIQRALDAGAEAIHLEEPEFWAAGGYEANFRREWQAYYGVPWQPPDSSPDAQYRASKLKYFLYRRTLSQIFTFVKNYGKAAGRTIRCYVPTHSLLNYADWRIVSPESSLLQVGADGYIAQVWTGTARTPNVYEGRRKERTFETAFLEYGAMQNLVRASGRRIWYLNDPVEDNPNHNWDDYRANWENTLTASLFQPEVWRYEIMPWPERVFNGKYPAKDMSDTRSVKQLERTPNGTGLGGFGPSNPAPRVTIPKAYESELQAVIRALGKMKQPERAVRWEVSGTQGVGVLVSDTLMFQRADPDPSDPNLGSFYGLAMPLLKRGIPVEPVQIENATEPGFLDRYRLLLLTYEGQKPPTASFHDALARWVRAGGALVVLDDDHDPYCKVQEWWNTPPRSFATPRQHLFEILGMPLDATGLQRVGKGVVLREALSPAALTYESNGADVVLKLARQAARATNLAWRESNALVLRRGPYVVAAGLDESIPNAPPVVLHGRFVDLFDAELPLRNELTLSPGKRALLFDLEAVKSRDPYVIAAACKVSDERYAHDLLKFNVEGIAETQAVVRILAPKRVLSVSVGGKTLPKEDYVASSNTLQMQFPNSVNETLVEVRFAQ
jgi:hypothetical protein